MIPTAVAVTRVGSRRWAPGVDWRRSRYTHGFMGALYEPLPQVAVYQSALVAKTLGMENAVARMSYAVPTVSP